MRVISGKFKGRQLVSFQADHIRPTTDRVKETLFNKLMGYLEDSRVLDLFSGTGNLAVECVSRGAAWVDLVENHPKSLEIIRKNLTGLGIVEGHKVHRRDAFQYIREYEGPAYDVVLADPPFTEKYAHDLATAIGSSALLHDNTLVVIEASAKERMDERYPGLNRLDQRKFGDKHLNFFERAKNDQGDIPR
jgi:16S rRNA (guanine966-N2)-methyltransferase